MECHDEKRLINALLDGGGCMGWLSLSPTKVYAVVNCTVAPGQNKDFTGCSLIGKNYANLDLSGTNYYGAKFTNAKFTNATLNGTSFMSASLNGADFSGADLTAGIYARGASFFGADLTGADLTGANLTGVQWFSTTCPDGTVSDVQCAVLYVAPAPAPAAAAPTPQKNGVPLLGTTQVAVI
jgi:hypothetical protein